MSAPARPLPASTMRIVLKLYASLTQYLPPEARLDNRLRLDIEDGATVASVIAPFDLPLKLVHLVLVNGVFVPREERATKVLVDGDVLAIWPPIAGG